MFKAGWRSDDAIQSPGSFHSIANPWFQINSAEQRKAQLRCITVVRLSRFSLQNCSSRFEHYSLKHWTGLLTWVFIFSLPLAVHRTDHTLFFFSWSPNNTLLSDFFPGFIPTLAMKWADMSLLPRPGDSGIGLQRKGFALWDLPAPCHHENVRLTDPWLLGMLSRGVEAPGLWVEESVGTPGPRQTGAAARATGCYLLLLCNLGLCANLKRPSCRLYSHSTCISTAEHENSCMHKYHTLE